MASNSGIPGPGTAYSSATPESRASITASIPLTSQGRRVIRQLEKVRKRVLKNSTATPRYIAMTGDLGSDSSDEDFPGSAPAPKRHAVSVRQASPPLQQRITKEPHQLATRPVSPPFVLSTCKGRKRDSLLGSSETQTLPLSQLTVGQVQELKDALKRQWQRERQAYEAIINDFAQQIISLEKCLETHKQAERQNHYQQYTVSDSEQETLFIELTMQLICDDSDNFAETMVYSACDHPANGACWTEGHPRNELCQFPECKNKTFPEAIIKDRKSVIKKIVSLVLNRQVEFFNSPEGNDAIKVFCDHIYKSTAPVSCADSNWKIRREKCTRNILKAVIHASKELDRRICPLIDQDH